MSIAGASKDQKLAAIITPPAKPNMLSRNLWLIFFVINTSEAPRAVITQVNSDAIIVWTNGSNSKKKSTNYRHSFHSIFLYIKSYQISIFKDRIKQEILISYLFIVIIIKFACILHFLLYFFKYCNFIDLLQ